jgi:hypothetical protein
MEYVKGKRFVPGSYVQPDGNRYQSETDESFPNRGGHTPVRRRIKRFDSNAAASEVVQQTAFKLTLMPLP